MCGKVVSYFEKTLIPTFKGYGSIWVLKRAQILNPEKGVTNNASESMNAVFHCMQQWKLVPLDVIIVSLYHLSSFYEREIVRSLYQCGRWQVKVKYD